MKIILSYLAFCMLSQAATAQHVGSENTYKGGFAVAAGCIHAEEAETLYIGPGNYEVNGTWEIYSKNIVVDPAAVITGTGTIQLFNASVAGGTASSSLLDGNGSANAIGVNVVINNASGVELFNKDFPTALTADGFTNSTTSSSYIGSDLDLAVDGANIILDADVVGDLRFDNDATISNYSANRMIITNNSTISHVARDAGGTAFFFPVGIAAADYTPANIAGAGAYNVSVTDYSPSSPLIHTPSEGMYRTWHIYGSTATSMTLYHNIATNGANYTDASAFITQYQGSGVWSSGSPEQQAAGEHTSSGTQATSIPLTAGNDNSFYTKTSDALSPLPVTLANFNAYKRGSTAQLEWETVTEQYNRGFEIEHSADGRGWTNIGAVASLAENGASNYRLQYSFVDHHPLSRQNFYRLKQTDFNGTYSYSAVRSLWFALDSKITVFPNPVANNITVAGLAGSEHIYIYNLSGKVVKQHKAAQAQQQVNLSLESLGAGSYYILIETKNGTTSTHKIEKVK